ncbi:hypothetical protein [Sphingomonas oryzagri]
MSFLELIDDTLGTHFHKPVYDPVKGREKLVKVIDGAATQHKEGRTKVPNRAWTVGNNNAISFSPKLSGNPVLIAGKETNYVPAERFPDFLAKLKAAVEKGDLDKEIEAALEGTAKRTTAGPTTSKGGMRSYSEESLLNIKVGGYRRGANPKPWGEIKATLTGEGYEAAKVDAAIKAKQAKEKAAK